MQWRHDAPLGRCDDVARGGGLVQQAGEPPQWIHQADAGGPGDARDSPAWSVDARIRIEPRRHERRHGPGCDRDATLCERCKSLGEFGSEVLYGRMVCPAVVATGLQPQDRQGTETPAGGEDRGRKRGVRVRPGVLLLRRCGVGVVQECCCPRGQSTRCRAGRIEGHPCRKGEQGRRTACDHCRAELGAVLGQEIDRDCRRVNPMHRLAESSVQCLREIRALAVDGPVSFDCAVGHHGTAPSTARIGSQPVTTRDTAAAGRDEAALKRGRRPCGGAARSAGRSTGLAPGARSPVTGPSAGLWSIGTPQGHDPTDSAVAVFGFFGSVRCATPHWVSAVRSSPGAAKEWVPAWASRSRRWGAGVRSTTRLSSSGRL